MQWSQEKLQRSHSEEEVGHKACFLFWLKLWPQSIHFLYKLIFFSVGQLFYSWFHRSVVLLRSALHPSFPPLLAPPPAFTWPSDYSPLFYPPSFSLLCCINLPSSGLISSHLRSNLIFSLLPWPLSPTFLSSSCSFLLLIPSPPLFQYLPSRDIWLELLV